MAATKANQRLQIKQSQTYDDSLDPTTAETSSNNLETDLNMLRSQFKKVLGGPNWNSAPAADLLSLSLSLNTNKELSYFESEFQSITVPAGKNFVELSASDAPSQNISLNTGTEGAISALLPGDAGAAHSLNAISDNKNLTIIREASTNKYILTSSGNFIWGLLQVDSQATDGNSFSTGSPNGSQISFVFFDPVSDVLSAVPIADIENKTIEYAYQSRSKLVNLPEDFFTFSLSFAEPPVNSAGGGSGSTFAVDIFTISSNGQTNFTLSNSLSSGGISKAFVNGIRYDPPVDFTISGNSFVWNNSEFTLETSDELVVEYEI